MVAPPRVLRMTALGGAMLLLLGAAAESSAQEIEQAVTVRMQARATIVAAVRADAPALDIVAPQVPENPSFVSTVPAGSATSISTWVRTERSGVPGPAWEAVDPRIVRTLEWHEPAGSARLVRYVVAVIS